MLAVAGGTLLLLGVAGATSICAPCSALDCAHGCHDLNGCPSCIMIADGFGGRPVTREPVRDLCAGKSCGDVCANSLGMLTVMRFCQPDGSCDVNAEPDCPAQCGNNEFLSECGSSCEGTCLNPNPICTLACRGPPACKCALGFVRNNGACVNQNQCFIADGAPMCVRCPTCPGCPDAPTPEPTQESCWPPAGTRFCATARECEEDEVCDGCTASSCSCGRPQMCTADCRTTCKPRPSAPPTNTRAPQCNNICCKALTAQCLACASCQTVEDYCEANPRTQGCSVITSPPECNPICCQAMIASCEACKVCQSVDDYCEANPRTQGCTQTQDPTQPPVPTTCPCGTSCRMAGGGSGVCQTDERTCAVNILPPNCPQQCGRNEEWSQCGNVCDPTCINREPVCTEQCELPGACKCQRGFVRNPQGACVEPGQCFIADGAPICMRCPTCSGCPLAPTVAPTYNCFTREVWTEEKKVWCCANERQGCPTTEMPTQQCGPNEQWSECANVCDGSCDEPNPRCTRECVRGGACKCQPGFVRDNGYCIERSSCAKAEGEACGFVFNIMPWAGDCAEGLECLCVGACANQMIADAPSTCVRPAAANQRWRSCSRSRARLSTSTIASFGGAPLATSCNKKQCRGVQTAEDCRNLKWGNCDGNDCAGANWNHRSKVCRLCKSVRDGELRDAGRWTALAAAQGEQRSSGASTGAVAGVIAGIVSAVAASVAMCVVVARRRAAEQQQGTLSAEEYHKDIADI